MAYARSDRGPSGPGRRTRTVPRRVVRRRGSSGPTATAASKALQEMRGSSAAKEKGPHSLCLGATGEIGRWRAELSVVILGWSLATQEEDQFPHELAQLRTASLEGAAAELEALLKRPMNPDVVVDRMERSCLLLQHGAE
ncbi:unnamed protein product [Symbiodinium sp. CCMP2592]|nr:unnamed protein product [Symbiodinium sp. CCMP2592]